MNTQKKTKLSKSDQMIQFLARLCPDDFITNVKQLMALRNMSNERLANRSNIDDVRLNSLLEGRESPTAKEIRWLASALNTRPTKLVRVTQQR